MTIQNMKYIIAVADYKSFSQAAKALFVSQSTLSTAIREVENDLGIHIFNRSNRGITLTYDGEDLIRYAREIVEQTEYLEQRYHSRKSIPMRFSVSTQHLPFSVRAFMKFFDEIGSDNYDVAIRECNTDSVIHDVANHRSELGVLIITDAHMRTIEKILTSYGLVFQEISEMKNYVFLCTSHPLASKDSLSLEDLELFPFVTYDQELESSHFTEEPLFYNLLRKNVHVSDRATKLALIRNTNCFSIGPDLANSNADKFHKNLGEVAAIPLKESLGIVHAGFIYQKHRELSPYALSYLTYLREDIRTLVNFL